MRSGYHQLVLDKQSRYITTFSTHVGLYQYKCLIIGVASAAKVFQHTIQLVIEGIKEARNVSDDIVFSKNMDEHNLALKKVLYELHQAGLTINAIKCEFNQQEVIFMVTYSKREAISRLKENKSTTRNCPTYQCLRSSPISWHGTIQHRVYQELCYYL